MSNSRNLMDIRELLHHIRAGSSDWRIQRDSGVDLRTIKGYREWAAAHGLLEGPLPPLEEFQALMKQTRLGHLPPQNISFPPLLSAERFPPVPSLFFLVEGLTHQLCSSTVNTTLLSGSFEIW